MPPRAAGRSPELNRAGRRPKSPESHRVRELIEPPHAHVGVEQPMSSSILTSVFALAGLGVVLVSLAGVAKILLFAFLVLLVINLVANHQPEPTAWTIDRDLLLQDDSRAEPRPGRTPEEQTS